MASKEPNNDLVILPYKPSLSIRERHLQRSNAKSHAARVSHAQRNLSRQEAQLKPCSENRHLSGLRLKKYSSRQVSIQAYASCIQHGNSDPFDTMALKITPEASCLLSSWRKEHSSSFCITAISWLIDSDMRRDADIRSELHGKSILLAAAAILATRYTGHLTLSAEAQRRKSDCLRQLDATSSSRSSVSAKIDLAKSLSLIFIALLLLNEVAEAKKHVEVLYESLSAVARLDRMEQIAMASRLYYYDMQTALVYLRPPILDASNIAEDWDAFLAASRTWSSGRLPIPSKIKYPIFTRKLEGFINRLQKHVDIQSEGLRDISQTASGHYISSNIIDAIDLAAAIYSHWILCQRECRIADTPLSHRQWYDESTASLCALAFIACAKYGPQFVDVRSRAWRAMQALRHNLANSPTLGAHHPHFWVHQRLQLWGHYLGASWESVVGLEYHEIWFIPRLRQNIREYGIRSWGELKHIIDQFLRVPVTYKAGLLWFLGMSDSVNPSVNGHWSHSTLEKLVFTGSL